MEELALDFQKEIPEKQAKTYFSKNNKDTLKMKVSKKVQLSFNYKEAFSFTRYDLNTELQKQNES